MPRPSRSAGRRGRGARARGADRAGGGLARPGAAVRGVSACQGFTGIRLSDTGTGRSAPGRARRRRIHFADLSVDKSARACAAPWQARFRARQAGARGSQSDGPGGTPLGLRARALRPTNRRDAVRRSCRFEVGTLPSDSAGMRLEDVWNPYGIAYVEKNGRDRALTGPIPAGAAPPASPACRPRRGLVPAEAGDAGEAHGDAGVVAGGALQALEGDLEHQAVVGLGAHGADRAEAVGGVVAHEAVDLRQLLVGEAEIGLADRGQRRRRRPRRRRCSRSSSPSACRGRAGRTSAPRR